jgi:hypothetical protein
MPIQALHITISTNNGLNGSIPAGFTGGVTSQLLDNVNSFNAATYKGLYLSTNHGFSWSQRTNAGLPVNPDGTKRVVSILGSWHKGIFFNKQPGQQRFIHQQMKAITGHRRILYFLPTLYVKAMESSANKIFAGVYAAHPS